MIKEVSASLIFFMDMQNEKTTAFYFIRHGKTVWNTEGLMQGHGDFPIDRRRH